MKEFFAHLILPGNRIVISKIIIESRSKLKIKNSVWAKRTHWLVMVYISFSGVTMVPFDCIKPHTHNYEICISQLNLYHVAHFDISIHININVFTGTSLYHLHLLVYPYFTFHYLCNYIKWWWWKNDKYFKSTFIGNIS